MYLHNDLLRFNLILESTRYVVIRNREIQIRYLWEDRRQTLFTVITEQ